MGKLIFVLAFALALAFFASENTGLVSVRFLTWHSRAIPLALLVIIAAVSGALVCLIATLPMHHRHRRELAKNRRELEDLKQPPP